MCRYHCGVGFFLTYNSHEERLEGYCSWGCCHSLQYRKGGRRWIRSSKSRPRCHLSNLRKLRGLSTLRTSAQNIFLNHVQETVAVREKVDNILSRIAVLEGYFSAPSEDVAEKKRRDQLLRYAIVPHPDPLLISFQQARGEQETITIDV